MSDHRIASAFGRCSAGTAAVVLALAVVADAQAADSAGCTGLFPAGAEVTLTGKTVAGKKNKASDALELHLTAGPSSAAGASFVAGRIDASLLKGGTVAWRAGSPSRWGNRCMDVVAPDGRHWSFLALTWEDDNAHPNLHGIFDRANGAGDFTGFIDTKSGAFHEALTVLKPATSAAPATSGQVSGTAPEATHSSLCQALFAEDTDHHFVGTGYATEPGTSPGYLELTLKPVAAAAAAITLEGHFVATDGPEWLAEHPINPAKSACIDLPDRRYAMLQLITDRGAEMILWLWGTGGVPQHKDRLVGFVTFPGTTIVHSKVALWRL